MAITTSKMQKHNIMSLSTLFKIKKYSFVELGLVLIAVLCFTYSLYITIKYANQVPLDNFSFRQTQTALTAYWLVKNGFSLAYETPVAGPPWSIPFEFPIYQYIVALASQITKYSLDATGRVVSFIFLALCLIPVRAIIKNLNLSIFVFYIFAALLFSSPLYLYWGRSFMIETTAVFFSIAAIKYFIDIAQSRSSLKSPLLFLIFITLGILQKATTGLPVLAVLGLVYLYMSIKDYSSDMVGKNTTVYLFFFKRIMLAFIYFGIPLAIGIIWTLYTDHIKMLNSLGVSLTSSALAKWNWGTVIQRLSFNFYSDVLWRRIFENNLSGALGLVILLVGFFSNTKKSIKLIIFVSITMGLLPMFLFINLHVRHDYYQTGNLIFLIFACAMSLGHVLNNHFENKFILIAITIIMLTSNYLCFTKLYLPVVIKVFDKQNSRDYGISEVLKREIPEDKYFVVFGDLWSSSFTYFTERKSFTVPELFKSYKEMQVNPERYIDEAYLGSILLCHSPGDKYTMSVYDLIQWASNNRRWYIGEVHGCFIALPEILNMEKISQYTVTQCEGSIDYFGKLPSGGHNNMMSVHGWTTSLGRNGVVPEKVFITLTRKNDEPIFLETLRVNRPDVNVSFGQPNAADAGFSRIINTTSLSGEYIVGLARINQGRHETCQFQKKVLINGADIHE
jgi:hypothetical protein